MFNRVQQRPIAIAIWTQTSPVNMIDEAAGCCFIAFAACDRACGRQRLRKAANKPLVRSSTEYV